MATVFLDFTAASNGSGANKDSPLNAMPAIVASNVYLFKGGARHVVPGGIVLTSRNDTDWGSYDPATGLRLMPAFNGFWPYGFTPRYGYSALATVTITDGSTATINLSNSLRTKIQGLRVTHNGSSASPIGIYSSQPSVSGYQIVDSEIFGVRSPDGTNGGNAIQTGNGSGVSSNHAVARCYVHDCDVDGIHMEYCTGLLIEKNAVVEINQNSVLGDNIQLAFEASNYLVRWNYMDHSNSDGKQCFISSLSSGSGGMAYQNVCIGRTGSANHTVMYSSQAGSILWGNIVIDGNIGINIEGAGTMACGNDISVSVPGAPSYSGIRCATDAGLRVHNNTIRQLFKDRTKPSRAIRSEGAGCTVNARNNRIIGFNLGFSQFGGTITEDFNVLADCASLFQNTAGVELAVGANDQLFDPDLASAPRIAIPFMLGDIPMLNPLGGMGTYIQGVRLINGRRLDPARAPIGAYPEGRY